MRRFVYMFMVLIVVSSMAGCARVKRIANDINWVVLDGQPSRDN